MNKATRSKMREASRDFMLLTTQRPDVPEEGTGFLHKELLQEMQPEENPET